MMRLEIHSAAEFLVHLLRTSNNSSIDHALTDPQLERFRNATIDVLRRRYRDHWFPDQPYKGSGYRCIRMNGTMDPLIAQAGESCGFTGSFLHNLFPSELTMWIDPKEVSYRIGENGSICVLYEEKEAAPVSFDNRNRQRDINTCKESLRNVDNSRFDSRRAHTLEQFVSYVSS